VSRALPAARRRARLEVSTSSVRRGQLQIAISTSGAAPAVARRLRRELREQFGPEWAAYIALLGDVRALGTQRIANGAHLAEVIAAAAELDFLERIAEGEEITPETALAEARTAADAAAAAAAAADDAADAAATAAADPTAASDATVPADTSAEQTTPATEE